ncbi:MAG TPA: NAD-dependent epimerase/dehydratase family protein [Longimicrobiales bacterium]|nr:NAD-dependent epimerase/dehydratase family protein [Longimicrobiales bacterium]
MQRILITGAAGQIGTELAPALLDRYAGATVVATDIKEPGAQPEDVAFQRLDCTDRQACERAVADHEVDTIYHLAAILSANAEGIPQKAWDVNMTGLFNILETAREHGCAVFTPSSIAAFGPDTPADPTPQDTLQRPSTMYGVTKVAGELLCDYYADRMDVDARGLRYPGLISYTAPPGGGTTDYAVEIFHAALRDGRYTCYLEPDTQLDMMYMPDALRAAMELMDADPGVLRHRNAFNITAMQLTPARLADAIRRHLPEFEMGYDVDPVRQRIAESWPRRLDDSAAREEWGWKPEYDIDAMVADMLMNLAPRLGITAPVGQAR